MNERKTLRYGFAALAVAALVVAEAAMPIAVSAHALYARPIQVSSGLVITSYKDDNAKYGVMQAYDCSAGKTYDGHGGTDFASPVGTPVNAATNGGIYYSYDNCATYGYRGNTCGGGYGNHVMMDHEGPSWTDGIGSVAIYAHMKKGTVMGLRAYVYCGVKIGEVGSSGNSSGPHLHFEIRDRVSAYSETKREPYAGACGSPLPLWVGIGPNNIPKDTCPKF